MIQLVSTNSERTPLRWTAIKCVGKDGPMDTTEIHRDLLESESDKMVLKLIDLKSYGESVNTHIGLDVFSSSIM